MKLSKLYIKGFRNFKEATINFNNQSLIIGANDVGKTNLLYELRILLDRGFSDLDLELKESDFYAYEETNEVIITAFFDDIKEDCILSKMKGDISGDGKLVIKYLATKGEDYKFFFGKSDADEDLHEYAIPYYRKVLNIKYINSKRDFWGYINKTKNILLQQAKEERSAETIDTGDALYKQISDKLKEVDSQIPELSYVKNATEQINVEPGAYLHPHQQRELARYLSGVLNGQVILTSHSPYINCYYPSWQQDLDLHYVGITRAKKACYMIVNNRRLGSKGYIVAGRDSEFLSLNGIGKLRNEFYFQ